jgi:hypothetical protein
MKAIVIYFFLITLSLSCIQAPIEVRRVLNTAGDNRSELEKVITHYKKVNADKLKLKAAFYLIGNLDGKFYFEGELLDYYSAYSHLFSEDQKRNKNVLDSISAIHGPFSFDKLEVKLDIKELKAEFLINNIEMAFKVWKEQPWGKDISFDQFCEYILPYRCSNEKPEYSRSEIYKQYNYLLDSICVTGGSVIDACCIINNELIKHGWQLTQEFSFLPDFPVKVLLEHNKGSCEAMSNATVLVMRALGIPVSSDFTPQWANRSLGHEWNVVLDKNGKNIEFLGMYSNPGIKHLIENRRPVIYRNTFAKQPQSLAMIKGKNDKVPDFFNNPFIKDVTDEYYRNCFADIQLNERNIANNQYVYACVFNNTNWVPVTWGKIFNNKVSFERLSCDEIVYLPAYFRNNLLIPADDPFMLYQGGRIKYLKADKRQRQNIILTRKYRLPWYIGNMAGGKFQCSDFPDFRNPVDLYKIPLSDSSLTWQEIHLHLRKPFRYYRYLGPDLSSGSIAELEFYTGTDKVHGTLFSDGIWKYNSRYAIENVMDGDILTFFESSKINGGWVGIDYGKPVKIDRIRYMPRNDDNSIVKGQEYELVYWDDGQWISAGIKIAENDNFLMYRDIPSDALYLLHNLTKGKEERVFTFENGRQVWW